MCLRVYSLPFVIVNMNQLTITNKASRVVLAIFSKDLNLWIVTSHLNWDEKKNDEDTKSLNEFLYVLKQENPSASIGFLGDVNNYLPFLMSEELKNCVEEKQRTFINDEIRKTRSIDFVGISDIQEGKICLIDEFPEDQSQNMALDREKRILQFIRGKSGITQLWGDAPNDNRCENAENEKHRCDKCIKAIKKPVIEQQRWFNYPRILNGHLSDHSLIRLDASICNKQIVFLQYNILAATRECAEYFEETVEQPWVLSQKRIQEICEKLIDENADFICLQEVDENSRETIENYPALKKNYSMNYLKHERRSDGVMILYKEKHQITEVKSYKLS